MSAGSCRVGVSECDRRAIYAVPVARCQIIYPGPRAHVVAVTLAFGVHLKQNDNPSDEGAYIDYGRLQVHHRTTYAGDRGGENGGCTNFERL